MGDGGDEVGTGAVQIEGIDNLMPVWRSARTVSRWRDMTGLPIKLGASRRVLSRDLHPHRRLRNLDRTRDAIKAKTAPFEARSAVLTHSSPPRLPPPPIHPHKWPQ